MPTSARWHRFSICRGGRLCPPGMAHNIFVGQGPRALPVGVVENRFGPSGRPTPTHHLPIELRKGRRLPTVVPTDFRALSRPPIGALPRNRLASSATGSASAISPTPRWLSGCGRPQGSLLRRGHKGCGKAGRCGERTKRCQWQRKRGERVAAVKISSVRRKAAQKFWAPQQDHRPLRIFVFLGITYLI